MSKVQEVSSGLGVSKYQLKIIIKLEITFKSPSTMILCLCHSTPWLSEWGVQLYSVAAFIPLNSSVFLSILFLSLHKDSLPEHCNLLHEYFSHQLQCFAIVVSWVPHQQCLASPGSCHSGKDTFEDCLPSITQFQSRQRQCPITDPPHAVW